MKKAFCILMILIAALKLDAQNFIDPPSLINQLNVNDSLFNFDNNIFIRGWNWNSLSRKLDSAMYMNAIQTNIDANENTGNNWNGKNIFYINGMNYIAGIAPVLANDQSIAPTQAQAMQFEPSIANYDTNSTFIAYPNDSCGAVWGFRYRSTLYDAIQNIKHNFVLDKSKLAQSGRTTDTVLKNPWRCDEIIKYHT